jgi:probable 2-oxoglutarate dehydrogenase E1 component DHKTD1
MKTGTSWQPVLSDPAFQDKTAQESCKRLCFVSGKLYYDLVKERQAQGKDGQIAFVRLEELNPFPAAHLKNEIAKFKNVKGKYHDFN